MQLTESGTARNGPPAKRHRVLVIDKDPAIATSLRSSLDGEYHVDLSHEIEEAEALVSNLLYSVVVAHAAALDESERHPLEFVQFIGLQSERTRVVVLGAPDLSRDDDGSLGLMVDVVLPPGIRMTTLAMLVSELARAA